MDQFNEGTDDGRGGLTHLEKETGLAWSTVCRIVKDGGAQLESAELLEAATGGEVSALDIMRRL